jgi:hypothetical protein
MSGTRLDSYRQLYSSRILSSLRLHLLNMLIIGIDEPDLSKM